MIVVHQKRRLFTRTSPLLSVVSNSNVVAKQDNSLAQSAAVETGWSDTLAPYICLHRGVVFGFYRYRFSVLRDRSAAAPKKKLFRLNLYAVTDSNMVAKQGYSLAQAVEASIQGGATLVQIREKDCSHAVSFFDTLTDHCCLCLVRTGKKHGILLFRIYKKTTAELWTTEIKF